MEAFNSRRLAANRHIRCRFLSVDSDLSWRMDQYNSPDTHMRRSYRVLLLDGPVNEVVRRQRTLYSNVLVLNDEDFSDVKLSLRGRDLRGGIFTRSILTGAISITANLNSATFDNAVLIRAQFGCAETGLAQHEGERRWPDDGCTWLQRAHLNYAQLQGTDFTLAKAEGASFDGALLYGAAFQGLTPTGRKGTGNSLGSALSECRSGSRMVAFHLETALLETSDLYLADFSDAFLYGANFDRADLDGAVFKSAHVWRSSTGHTIRA